MASRSAKRIIPGAKAHVAVITFAASLLSGRFYRCRPSSSHPAQAKQVDCYLSLSFVLQDLINNLSLSLPIDFIHKPSTTTKNQMNLLLWYKLSELSVSVALISAAQSISKAEAISQDSLERSMIDFYSYSLSKTLMRRIVSSVVFKKKWTTGSAANSVQSWPKVDGELSLSCWSSPSH